MSNKIIYVNCPAQCLAIVAIQQMIILFFKSHLILSSFSKTVFYNYLLDYLMLVLIKYRMAYIIYLFSELHFLFWRHFRPLLLLFPNLTNFYYSSIHKISLFWGANFNICHLIFLKDSLNMIIICIFFLFHFLTLWFHILYYLRAEISFCTIIAK